MRCFAEGSSRHRSVRKCGEGLTDEHPTQIRSGNIISESSYAFSVTVSQQSGFIILLIRTLYKLQLFYLFVSILGDWHWSMVTSQTGQTESLALVALSAV
jgi:hypothetical protein